MVTLTLSLPADAVCNGKQITFRAPCDCTGVSGIVIGDTTYDLVDAQNNTISTNSFFVAGAMITVVLDIENNKAYIQNASIPVDSIPTSGSNNFITSGGVYSAIMGAIEGGY